MLQFIIFETVAHVIPLIITIVVVRFSIKDKVCRHCGKYGK
jgi:hypothetical protein